MAQSHCEDILADFAHQLRQPLSALEALTSYLDLIVSPEDVRAREQLCHMHAEIDHADQVLRDAVLTLRARLQAQARSTVAPGEEVAVELARPLTKAAMASVTY